MGKVRLQVLPSLAETLGMEPAWEEVIPEGENGDGRSVIALLSQLGARYQLFGQIVFDMSTQKLTGRVAIFLNGRSLGISGLKTRLGDGDTLTFVQVIEGG